MKKVWLYLVRCYLKIGLWCYFKRIHVINKEYFSINEPALILCNHQNALLDPLLIAANLNEFAYFLTRAGVFKKKLVAKLLDTFNMIPVYRIRDGWSNLSNNNAVFEKAVEVLERNKKVTLFPEGSHNLARRVRPLSKGFTRIVLSALAQHPEMPLKLIPVGVNYQNALRFGDSASLYVGKPIDVHSLLTDNDAENSMRLKQTVFDALTGLTTHIPEEGYEETLQKLEQRHVDFLNPETTNACIQSNFTDCNGTPTYKTLSTIRKILKAFYCLSIFPVYAFWKWYVQPKIKQIEFTATFRFAVSLVLIPVWIICVAFTLYFLLGSAVASFYVLAMLILSLIVSKL